MSKFNNTWERMNKLEPLCGRCDNLYHTTLDHDIVDLKRIYAPALDRAKTFAEYKKKERELDGAIKSRVEREPTSKLTKKEGKDD